MNMIFKPKTEFLLHRNEVGDCTIDIRRHILFIPYWINLLEIPMHLSECLIFIKNWCVIRGIHTVTIHDPDGVKKKITINYQRYKNESVEDLQQ